MSKKINLPKIIHDPNKMNLETVRQKNKKKKIVFIPTMGALHEAGYQGREHYSVEKKALSKAYFKDFIHNINIYL